MLLLFTFWAYKYCFILGWYPTHIAIRGVKLLESFGLPYWSAIMSFTILVRLGLTPLALRGLVTAAKLQKIHPQIKRIQDRMKNEPGFILFVFLSIYVCVYFVFLYFCIFGVVIIQRRKCDIF